MITTQDFLVSYIQTALSRLGWDFGSHDVYLDFPQNNRFGDLSTNIALQLSKSFKKSPVEIASSIIPHIQRELQEGPLTGYIKDIKVEGAGFINFYFNDSYFYEELASLISKGKSHLKVNLGKGKKVLIEFVSANPTGPLSVAHARQAAVGDALASIMEFLGFKVQREYYLNDEGNQINILGRSVELRLKELGGEKIEFPEDHYQGDYIYDIARKVKSHPSTALGAGKSKVKSISEFAVDYILKIIKKELDGFGVRFDCWYSQKALAKSGKIEKALAELKKKGLLYEEGGALWFKSTEFGDDKDRVVIKSDGSHTYLTPDIAYHQDKYKRGFKELINLWGPDHHGYINRLKASVKAFNHDPDTLSIIIVQLASIFREGKPVQMSTRKGQYITLREVLDEVGRDASRFFFLMRRTSSHLDFDLEVAKRKTQENPVYYVQYAHARICSILNNSQVKIGVKDFEPSLLKEKEELALIKELIRFTAILSICLNTKDPYMLTVYLSSLAESFHKFYDLHRVLGQGEELTHARLCLLEGARIAISTGLELLGVSSPDKM